MLRRVLQSISALITMLTASSAWAQAWGVCWGPPGSQVCVPASVPALSPWMLVAVSVLLALAAVWMLRRRSGLGALLIAGVLVLAAAGSHQIKDAWASPYYYILTAAGQESHTCPPSGYPMNVYNGTASPVQIFISPSNGANLNWPVGPSDTKCASGMILNNSEQCYLPCASVYPDDD